MYNSYGERIWARGISKEEESRIEPLSKFGFIHNEMEYFWIFDYGRCKFPDFVHETEKIVLEYREPKE